MKEYDNTLKQIEDLTEKLNSPTTPKELKDKIKETIQDLMMEANLILGQKSR
jgi:hypothetical protein